MGDCWIFCCMVRRMNFRDEEMDNEPLHPPNNPDAVRDFVGSVDIYPLSPTYGSLISISWGTASGFNNDTAIEYHHGGLLEVGNQLFLTAGSLR
jgi:hypothetical protein